MYKHCHLEGENDTSIPHFGDTLNKNKNKITQEFWPEFTLQMDVGIFLMNKTGSTFNMLV